MTCFAFCASLLIASSIASARLPTDEASTLPKESTAVSPNLAKQEVEDIERVLNQFLLALDERNQELAARWESEARARLRQLREKNILLAIDPRSRDFAGQLLKLRDSPGHRFKVAVTDGLMKGPISVCVIVIGLLTAYCDKSSTENPNLPWPEDGAIAAPIVRRKPR